MEEKKLVRSRDRWLAGICGGIAEYMGWPKDNVRLGWLLLTLFTAFSGLLIYLILWIVMPAGRFEPSSDGVETFVSETSQAPKKNSGSMVIGLTFIGLGALGLLHRFVPEFNWQMIWPIALIVLGLILILPKAKQS